MATYTIPGKGLTGVLDLGAITYIDSLGWIVDVISTLMSVETVTPANVTGIDLTETDSAMVGFEACSSFINEASVVELFCRKWRECGEDALKACYASIADIGEEFRRHQFYAGFTDSNTDDMFGGHEFALIYAELNEVNRAIKQAKSTQQRAEAIAPFVLAYVYQIHGDAIKENFGKITYNNGRNDTFKFVQGTTVNETLEYHVVGGVPIYRYRIITGD